MPIDPSEPDADLKMLCQPDEWPSWPRLPMKRRVDGKREFGVVLDVGDYLLWFPDRNIWERIEPHELTFNRIILQPAMELLIEEGWRVD